MPKVLNASSQKEIYISFVATGGSATGESIQILPRKSVDIQVEAGTMKLYVWLDSELIWSGVVPTLIQKPLVIHPEHKSVTYEGVSLPSTLQKSTSRSWWILLVFLLILGIFLVYWFFKR